MPLFCCAAPAPAGRELLCDALGTPYPEGLQAAYRAQRVLSAPAQVRLQLALGCLQVFICPRKDQANWLLLPCPSHYFP